MNKILLMTSLVALLAACTPTVEETENSEKLPTAPQIIVPGLKGEDGTIQENPNSITLSNYTQEQQKIDREFYAQQLAGIASQRKEYDAEGNVIASTASAAPMAQTLAQPATANVGAYAQASTNAVGQALFPRTGITGSCSAYPTPDDAQRAFLQAGGPANDSLGIDADGDGFACAFNPATYRGM